MVVVHSAEAEPGPRELRVEVPDNVEPGKTKLRVNSGGGALLITVPEDAVTGDMLCLTEGTDGNWSCFLTKASAGDSEFAGKLGIRKGELRVPRYAIPGRTKLQVTLKPVSPLFEGSNTSERSVSVTVPKEALIGDRVEVTMESDSGTMVLKVLRDLNTGDRNVEAQANVQSQAGSLRAPLSVALTYRDVDPQVCYDRMVEAVRLVGGYVNPKMTRGTAPPLHILGMVAVEPIEKDEVLLVIPAGVHISPETCKQVMPEVFNAVEALPNISSRRRTEIAQNACVAACMQAAAFDHGFSAPKVWHPYVDSLLAERFEGHPYWRALSDQGRLEQALQPSWEAAYARMMAGDALALHGLILDGIRPEVLGPNFDAGLFLQAKLCLLSREFGTPRGSALVPVMDCFNHCAANPGAHQSWDLVADTMILKSLRAHHVGEEVYITYGNHSNPLLLRTYGFAVPPSMEPSWTTSCAGGELLKFCSGGAAAELAEEFFEMSEVQLSSQCVSENLKQAIGACSKGGGNVKAFLREWCTTKIAVLDEDASLKPSIDALSRVREQDRQSASWWTEVALDRSDAEEEQGIWVKMSEYLCLTAHLEALDFIAGNLPEERCLGRGAGLRQELAAALESLELAAA